jgi:hypothetical protein
MVYGETIVVSSAVLIFGTIYYIFGDNTTKAKDVAQIVFWGVASCIALLTYINARKGILQPIRTEIFKAQLSSLKAVETLFRSKQEHQLRDDIAFSTILTINAQNTLSAFAKVIYGVTYSDSAPRMRVGDGWRPLESSIADALQNHSWLSEDLPRDEREDFWRRYQIHGLTIPLEHKSGIDRIAALMNDPVLPSELKVAMEDYISTIRLNVDRVQHVFNECAPHMRQRFSTLESIDAIQDGTNGASWMLNCFNRDLHESSTDLQLQPKAAGILQLVRDYLQIDYLLHR